MTKKEIKKELYRLLALQPEDINLSEWKFIDTYLNYEIINKYIDETGKAVLLPRITTEEVKYWVNITEVLQYFNANEPFKVE